MQSLILNLLDIVVNTHWRFHSHVDCWILLHEMLIEKTLNNWWWRLIPLLSDRSCRLQILMADVIVSQSSLSPVVVIVPNVPSIHLLVIYVIGIERLKLVIIVIKFIIALLILDQVCDRVYILFDNSLVVLASFVKEGIKRHHTSIEIFLLSLLAQALLLELLALFRAKFSLACLLCSVLWLSGGAFLIGRNGSNLWHHWSVVRFSLLWIAGRIRHDVAGRRMHGGRDRCGCSAPIRCHHHSWHYRSGSCGERCLLNIRCIMYTDQR